VVYVVDPVSVPEHVYCCDSVNEAESQIAPLWRAFLTVANVGENDFTSFVIVKVDYGSNDLNCLVVLKIDVHSRLVQGRVGVVGLHDNDRLDDSCGHVVWLHLNHGSHCG
jgi:hypothetical protein